MEENEKVIYEEDNFKTNAKIIVIGVGGGGSNAVNGMIHDKNDKVEYWVFNTDSQALASSPCDNKIILGKNTTKGLGAGGNPEKGKEAAEDSYAEIQSVVSGADMVFIACGEGGGTGTGASPVVAKAAKEAGCLVLAIVTRPFNFEGEERNDKALEGINNLKPYVDALIIVSNNKMLFINGKLSIKDALAESNKVLAQSVKTLTDLILIHGIINLDFADVKTTLTGKGLALIGIGFGKGENKAIEAAENAINSPLLETTIRGSKSMLINFTLGECSSAEDVQTAVDYITVAAGVKDNKVSVIFGIQIDESLGDTMKVAIIATDFDKNPSPIPNPAPMPTPSPTPNPIPTPKPIKISDRENNVEKDSSATPDYLTKFFNTPISTEEVEEKKEAYVPENDTTTTFTINEEVEDEDDAVVISKID